MRWKFTTSMSRTRVETFRMVPKCCPFPEIEKLDSGLMLASYQRIGEIVCPTLKSLFFSTHAYSTRRTDRWPAALNQKQRWTSSFWNSKLKQDCSPFFKKKPYRIQYPVRVSLQRPCFCCAKKRWVFSYWKNLQMPWPQGAHARYLYGSQEIQIIHRIHE